MKIKSRDQRRPRPMTDTTLSATDSEVVFLRHSNLPTLILIIVLAGAFIGACGLYTGVSIGQRRSDNLLRDQRVEYESRLVQQDSHHNQELKRLATDTSALGQALTALTVRINARSVIADQTAVTANAALALAASSVAAHPVTRAEFSALTAKTTANTAITNRSVAEHFDVKRNEYQALTNEVQAGAAIQASAADALRKKAEAEKNSSWFGGRK